MKYSLKSSFARLTLVLFIVMVALTVAGRYVTLTGAAAAEVRVDPQSVPLVYPLRTATAQIRRVRDARRGQRRRAYRRGHCPHGAVL